MAGSCRIGYAGAMPGAATLFRRAAAAAVDLLLPPRCPGCAAFVAAQSLLCAPCFGRLPVLPAPACAACSEPLPPYVHATMRCAACLADAPPWTAVRAPFLYEGLARDLVLALKNGREELAAVLARDMRRAAGDWLDGDALPLPVPLHRSRLAARGFNQAAWIARHLAPERYAPDWLVRTRDTGSTRGLSRAGRLRSVSGAFDVPARHRPRLKGRNVVLVDDVLTSGATARACCAALRRAGVADVHVLVYARVARNRDRDAALIVPVG